MTTAEASEGASCLESQDEQAQGSDTNASEERATGPQNQTQPPAEDIPSTTRERFMVNRIIYLGMISFVSPFINFALHWEGVKSMGITFGLMLWLMFGVMWCGGFAGVMGPMFTFFATVVQQLDVIPALGSSLWTVISTFVMVAVVRDPFPAFLHNLPLFSLAIANAALLGLQVPRDFSNRASHATSLADSRAIGQVMGFVAYRFREGKLECVTSRGSEIRHWCFTFHAMSTPDQAKEVHNGIVENGYSFINGRNLNLFRDVFIAWRRQAQSVVERVNRRRIFCLAGLLCESVAVIVVISLIGNIQGSGSNMFGSFETASSTSGIPYFTSPLEFSLLQVVLSVIVICFSDYLYILVNISRSVTCETEVRAIMLHCVSSRWFNWAGSDYSYLENGRRLRGLNIHFDEASIPVKELPLLGFFGDQDESERCNATILTNAANSKQILIRRVGESLLRASLYNGEADRQTLLNEKLENIAIEVSDRIV